MPATFSWNKSQQQIILDKGLTRPFFKAVAETAARRMDKYVPMQTGMLAQTYDTSVDAKQGYITYRMPYAEAQYYGEEFDHNTDKHPLATALWDEMMWYTEKEAFTREVDKLRRRFSV